VDAEKALRYMAAGKHMGKVLIQMSDFVPTRSVSQFLTSGTHIVTGGLGGFGMELARWLFMNGATKVVLTSRRGIQESRQTWKMAALGNVVISVHDVCDDVACGNLITEQGGDLRGVWHLATVLEDVGFANMTEEKWSALHRVKAIATENLDRHTRTLQHTLDAFVVFSSISSMFGNVGQSNYASANNTAEMLVHNRNRAGLGGIAIQWGAIDNVGVMMKELRNGFTNRVCEFQNIDHSIASLHRLLQFNGVYSCYTEKQMTVEYNEDIEMSIVQIQLQLARVLGGSAEGYEYNVAISNFGLDSLSSVELANWVNRFVKVKITATYFSGTDVTIARLCEYIVSNTL
jgi:fatty acid synthase